MDACEAWRQGEETGLFFGGPTCYFGNGEAEADTGVGDGHDGRHNGEPPDLVEIRDLRQNNLYAREDDHVGGVGLPARGVVAVPVEAVRPFHGPEHMQVFGGEKESCSGFTWSCTSGKS